MSKEIKAKVAEALTAVSAEGAKSKKVTKAINKTAKELSKKIEKAEDKAAKKASKLQKIANEVIRIQDLAKKPTVAKV